MTYDMSRGVAPKVDPTMPRVLCRNHGEVLGQAYLGRERYGCFVCALDEWNANEGALAILRAANIDERGTEVAHPAWTEASGDEPGPCRCATCAE